jgi:diacylglycerol kinase (ATP)
MPRPSTPTQGSASAEAVTIALIVNAKSRESDPDSVAESLRSFGAEVAAFGIDEIDRAVASGADRVAVAGGDGSIAPVAAAAGARGKPLAVIPAGTANDFARRLELPLDLSAACRLAVRGRRVRELELGWMEALEGEHRNARRPFVNVASTGLPAPAARTARAWKGPLGPIGYAAGALVAGLTARPVAVGVACARRTLLEGNAWQVTVAATGAFGGGAEIEEADPCDGALDVVAIGAGPRPALVALAYRLRSGTVTSHGRAVHSRCCSVDLRVPPGTDFNVDGEVLSAGPARFTAQAAAFGLIVA